MLEKGKWVGPIIDQHMHLDRTNLFLDAVADFSSSGGTGIMLVHKPSFSYSLPVDLEGYRRPILIQYPWQMRFVQNSDWELELFSDLIL